MPPPPTSRAPRSPSSRLRATLYLPDPALGYYRGTRFDWSGVDRQPDVERARVLRPVVRALRPDAPRRDHRAGRGVPDRRFGAGLRGGEAGRAVRPHRRRRRPRKPDESAYQRFATYDIVDPGKWTVDERRGPDRVRRTSCSDTGGYAYVYRKTLRREGDTLVLEHSPGEHRPQAHRDQRLQPQLLHARQPDRPGLTSSCGSRSRRGRAAAQRRWPRSSGNEVWFLRPFEAKQTVFTEVDGFGGARRTTTSSIENRRPAPACASPAIARCRSCCSGRPGRPSCPEPYIDMSVAPGTKSAWRITYEFYEVPAAAPSK